MTEYSLDIVELEKELNEMTAGWQTDEMVDLIIQCELAFSDCDGRIEQLKRKGWKKLYDIITGINRKNKIRVREEKYLIQKISFAIEKILMQRTELVNATLVRLNDKVNREASMTRSFVESLWGKMHDNTIAIALVEWQSVIRNLRTEDGRKYIDVSDGMKVLLIVSDLFSFVHNRTERISVPRLETVLQELDLNPEMKTADFYRDIIQEKGCLPLYIREDFGYKGGDISPYGRTIYEINDFLSSDPVKLIADNTQKSVDDMCKDAFIKDKRSVKTLELCKALLGDLGRLYTAKQRKIEQPPEDGGGLPEGRQQGPEIKGNQGDGEKMRQEYSLLRLTPDGFGFFKDGKVISTRTEPQPKYTFGKEDGIQLFLDSNSPYMVTAPTGYYKKCKQEIKDFLSKRARYLSLADYYMYLWFQNKSVSVQKNWKVAFIEYYDHVLYVSVYEVNTTGDSYQKGVSTREIDWKRAATNIAKDILSLFKDNFSQVDKGDVIMFGTFKPYKYISDKLDRIGVKAVDDRWEDILKTDNEALGKIIQEMTGGNPGWR